MPALSINDTLQSTSLLQLPAQLLLVPLLIHGLHRLSGVVDEPNCPPAPGGGPVPLCTVPGGRMMNCQVPWVSYDRHLPLGGVGYQGSLESSSTLSY